MLGLFREVADGFAHLQELRLVGFVLGLALLLVLPLDVGHGPGVLAVFLTASLLAGPRGTVWLQAELALAAVHFPPQIDLPTSPTKSPKR